MTAPTIVSAQDREAARQHLLAGRVSLPNLFESRRQLFVYRAFFEPGVLGWPDHACRGCSMVADQVAHLNARDTPSLSSRVRRNPTSRGWRPGWAGACPGTP